MAKLPSAEEIEASRKAFEPYTAALGRVAHSWNHLQSAISDLFCTVAGLDDSMGKAIWNALRHDKSQRDMLDAALNVAASCEEWIGKFPKAKTDIVWLLEKTTALSSRRDVAVHAPCTSGRSEDGLSFEIQPFIFTGNRLAEKLRGKDILQEFAWYEETANALRKFCWTMDTALESARRPWPDRPLMPSLQQAPARKAPRPQSAPK
jgi:hypothetical protein